MSVLVIKSLDAPKEIAEREAPSPQIVFRLGAEEFYADKNQAARIGQRLIDMAAALSC